MPLSATYRVDIPTLHAFFFAWFKRNNFTRRKLGVMAILTLALFAISVWPMLPGLFPSNASPVERTAGMIIIGATLVSGLIFSALVMFVVSPVLSYIVQMAGYAFGPLSRTSRYAEISQAGIRNNRDAEFQAWTQVHEVIETRKAILIFTNRNCAIMVPKSAFTTPEAANGFATAAQTYWQDSRTVTSVF